MIKVSIIVPVYNSEPYLKGCMDGLINQSLQDIEIICVDNASTDKSLDILKGYKAKDSRVHILQNKKNMGQGYSLNRGLEASKGEYIAECDADDRAAYNMYEELYNLAKETNADVCQGGFFNFTVDRIEPNPIATKKVAFNAKNLVGADLMGFIGRQPHIMSAIYKRSFIVDNDLWYREGKNFEDTSLCFKHRTTAKVYALHPDCLYFYRKDNMSSGSHTSKNFDDLFEQFKEVKGYASKHKLTGYDEIIGVWKYYTYQWAMSCLDGEQRKQFILKAIKDMKHDKVEPTYYLGGDFEIYKKLLGII